MPGSIGERVPSQTDRIFENAIQNRLLPPHPKTRLAENYSPDRVKTELSIVGGANMQRISGRLIELLGILGLLPFSSTYKGRKKDQSINQSNFYYDTERRSFREFFSRFDHEQMFLQRPVAMPIDEEAASSERGSSNLSIQEKPESLSKRRKLLLHLTNEGSWWIAIMVRLITFYVHTGGVFNVPRVLWRSCAGVVVSIIPERLRFIIGGILVAVLILVGAMHTIVVGILMQFVIAVFVLRTQADFDIFSWISQIGRNPLGFANISLVFVTDASVPSLPWFPISAVPSIIFFAGTAQLLMYWGVLQWLVAKSAIFFYWALRISGAEAIVATSSPFLGQGEAVMLIRPFLPHITNAELHQTMCSGFATIARSVLVAYINLGVNGQALISSCVMSIPVSLVVSKLRYSEEDAPPTARCIAIDERNDDVNAVHAFTNVVWLGLKIAGIVIAVLSSVIALVALVDALLAWWGQYINIGTDLTIELIMSYLLFPVAFLLGVPGNGDLRKVARLIGIKIIKNEFAAFQALQTDPTYATLSSRSRLTATYSLCGFGNLGAMGTQIGLF
ncbi:hypothetical protein G7Y89_g11052 [Cudoniella acicularis]|uniref:Uncharacterized protein n=1 Tax=Cudoniella acicularis TaxID=354080 RepID=A0A8H4VY69_9HELO|nr:hypothetical protein G7Y89_g11052 [Cudoniella acicularis]